MKKILCFLVVFFLILSIFSGCAEKAFFDEDDNGDDNGDEDDDDGEEKNASLKLNDFEADTNTEAVVLYGPGTFTLTGKIKNNLLKEEFEKDLDLVFILDASGSMQGEISAVKNSIKSIMNKINNKCNDCMHVGIFVFEGFGSNKSGFNSKSYCDGSDDVGAIYLTSNSNLIKQRLGQVNASCGWEPWGCLTKQILNDSSFGWRANSVKAIIVVTDEDDDSGQYLQARNVLENKDAFFFGIVGNSSTSGTGKSQMQKILQKVKGNVFDYDKPNKIPKKIVQAIKQIIATDNFNVLREKGPAGWDNLGANFEIPDVAREGGKKTFQIILQTPDTYSEPFAYFNYKIKAKNNPNVNDDAWLKVIMNQIPEAHINPLTDTIGDVPLEVRMNAEGSTDPDGDSDLDKFEWDCESDGVTDFTTQTKVEEVACNYNEKDRDYELKLTVIDKSEAEHTDSLTITTNPNKPPTVSLSYQPSMAYPNQDVQFTASASDEDGTIEEYAWDFGDGDTKTCSNCNIVTHQYSSKGQFIVQVTVKDSDQETANDIKTINIANRPPAKPTLNAIPKTGFSPLQPTLTALTTDPDNDQITHFQWNYGDGSAIETTDCSLNQECHKRTHSYQGDNAFTVKARARDSEGDWSDWSETIITVRTKNAVEKLEAANARIGEKPHIRVSCTDPSVTALIEIKNEDGNIVHHVEGQCHGQWIEPNYEFKESGVFQAVASIKNGECSNCPKNVPFIVSIQTPEIKSPESHYLLVLLIGLMVVFLLNKNQRVQ